MAQQSYKKFVASAATATLVASALIPVASAASVSTSAFTDVPASYKEAVDFVVKNNIASGISETQFGISQQIKRGDVAIMIAAAAGLNDEKAPASGFSDVPKRGALAINSLKAAGVINGKTATKFGFEDNVTRGEAALMLQKAFKLEAGDTKNSFTDVSDRYDAAVDALVANKVTSGINDKQFGTGNNIKRGDFAKFLFALKDKIEAPAGEATIESVKAINAKTIEVKFNKAIDTEKAKFELKRGTVKPTVKAPVFSEDKKTVTIEANTALAAGDYTVTVTGISDEAITGKTTVAAEKLTKISFLSEVAVINNDDIIGKVSAENQYGEDITSKLTTASNSNITVTASKGNGTNSIDKDGNLTVGGAAGTFNVDDKVVVTVVDSVTGVTATKTVTVAKAAAVESIVLGEIKTDDEELAKKPLNVANMNANAPKYYVPVTIKDQYGNTLKATELAGVSVVSSNGSIVKTNGFADTKNGTVIKLQTPTPTATHGTAVLTVIAAGTGKTANTSIVVKENSKLDTVALQTPSTVLKNGVAAELPLSITNTYGEEVALKDVTVGGNNSNALTLDTNTTINVIGGTLKVEQDYLNKKAVLKLTPSQKNVNITVVTATGKSQVLNLTADEAPVVSGIKGVSEDFVSLLANDVSLSTDLDTAVEFVDQYGEEIAAPTFDATDATNALDFTIKPKDVNNDVTTYTNGKITASTTAGTEDYEIILKDATGKVLDTKDVTVSVVDADKLTSFGIDDLNKFYTGDVSAAHDQEVTIHGLYNGKRVEVNQDMVKDVSATNGLKIAANGEYTAEQIVTDSKDVASTLTVLVANKDNTYTVKKEVLYSDAAPVSQSLVTKYDSVEVKGGVVQVPSTELNAKSVVPGVGTASKLQFVAKDQYGVQRVGTDYNVIVTNKETTGTFDSDGLGSGFIPADAGKSLQLNVRIDGLLQTVKVIAGS
ncbi:S-layer homology domain-containing protein [Sporosarcina sp. D27]|uniref:S-layer homology domain-containing protein n=1 Tax=Sporosarcina sp. D27 TaxID=1382305 RepID=UPI000471DCCF|nr:S-layer homology domain-containing protein [Sporosarcina sp. D27]